MLGWIFCQGRHSISRVIQAISMQDQKKHHSAYYRFFTRGKWKPDSLGKVLFHLLLPFLGDIITAIVDDTLSRKSGPHIFGAGMHHDAVASTYGRGTQKGGKVFFAFGHNWVVLALWIPIAWYQPGGMAIPVLFRLYRSKKTCPKNLYRKRTELAREMIDLLCSWIPQGCSLHITGDSEYSCKTIVRNLPKGVSFTGTMNMDAALYDVPGQYCGKGRKPKKGKRLPSPKKLAAMTSVPWDELTVTIYGKEVTILVKSQMALWYTVTGTKLGRMVVTRDPKGSLDDRAYFSTDEHVSLEQILIRFARRWEIEVMFRNAKQLLGLQHPQNGWWRRNQHEPKPKKKPGPNPHPTRGEMTITHTIAMVFVTYGLILVWYLKHGNPSKDVQRVKSQAQWYRHKKTPSFMDMIAAIRREFWIHRFSQHPILKRVPRNVLDLLPQCFLNVA